MKNETNISRKFVFLPLLIYLFLLLLLIEKSLAAEEKSDPVLLFAAASVTETIKKASELWIAENYQHDFKISSASSGILAKQILSGAPADIYISASYLWIKELKKKNMLIDGSVHKIFGNRLVLIGKKDTKYNNLGIIENNLNIKKIFAESLKHYRLSIADNTHVPAGIYTEQTLKNLKLWNELYPKKLAFGADVRKTLKFVALGSCPLGIVYFSDTLLEPNVKILGIFSEKLHDPINYWVTLTSKTKNPISKEFLSFLVSNKAQKVFSKYGFTTNGK